MWKEEGKSERKRDLLQTKRISNTSRNHAETEAGRNRLHCVKVEKKVVDEAKRLKEGWGYGLIRCLKKNYGWICGEVYDGTKTLGTIADRTRNTKTFVERKRGTGYWVIVRSIYALQTTSFCIFLIIPRKGSILCFGRMLCVAYSQYSYLLKEKGWSGWGKPQPRTLNSFHSAW